MFSGFQVIEQTTLNNRHIPAAYLALLIYKIWLRDSYQLETRVVMLDAGRLIPNALFEMLNVLDARFDELVVT